MKKKTKTKTKNKKKSKREDNKFVWADPCNKNICYTKRKEKKNIMHRPYQTYISHPIIQSYHPVL